MSTPANPINMSGYPSQITVDKSGNIWFTEGGAVAEYNPSTGAVAEIDFSGGLSPEPNGITLGPDGNIWFTTSEGFGGPLSEIGVINPVTQSIVAVIDVPASGSTSADPYGITAGPDGRMWFTENGIGAIGSVSVNAADPSQDKLGTSIPIPAEGHPGACWQLLRLPESRPVRTGISGLPISRVPSALSTSTFISP